MLIAFQITALLILAAFIFFVMDLRQKPGMKPVTQPGLILLMKVVSCSSLAFYAFLVWLNRTLSAADLVALSLTALGTSLVVAAKISLERARAHTWTGYTLERPKLVQSGIYAFLRHPLYTGIFLFEVGGSLFAFPRMWLLWEAKGNLLATGVVGVLVYMTAFNWTMASKESEKLHQAFQGDFEKYRSQVRAFLPWRKISTAGDAR